MTPERWQQVKTTLAETLEQETGGRSEFLREACADDTALRREVSELLNQPADEFDSCAARVGLMSDQPMLEENVGRRIGAYELIRELGRGGMGAVWLARRADQQFEKLVAIKLLKRGTDTDEVLRRFHAERQILARLDHPNISRLLDAGTTDDGLPYFVMEYVDGARLTDFAFAQNLSLGERLRLFLKICHAVQFAHQNLVVHRDLKPGNILVTPDCEPKLLDFGVAKLLAESDDAWQQTIVGRERFTPGYASPEQVRAEPITTVSDVYSLGALLYELLTDTPPHRFSSKSPTATQIARVVCEMEPLRPSAAARDPEMGRQLRGDLDTILFRALAKTPARRYRGAGNLADDLRRYLENRPVRARPDTFAYRAGKFFRRNRTGTAAAALILLSLIAGVFATVRQAHIANRERERAERRFKEVRQIANSLMFEVHNAIADLPGALAARQLVTHSALQYLDSLTEEGSDDLSLKQELATAYEKIGVITFDSQAAVEAHQRAVALNEALVEARPKDSSFQKDLAESYGNLSDVLKITGHSEQSVAYAQKSLGVLQTLAAAAPNDLEAQSALANGYVGVAISLSDAGDFHGELAASEQALPIQERVAAQSPPGGEAQHRLAGIYGLLSDAHREAGNLVEAANESQRELQIAQTNLQTDRGNARYQRDLWSAYFRAAEVASAQGDSQAALENGERAAALISSLAAADPEDMGHQRWLAVTDAGHAETLAMSGQADEAFRLYAKAIALSEKLLAADPGRAETSRDLARMHHAVGRLLIDREPMAAAVEHLQKARAFAEDAVKLDPTNARVRSTLARIYHSLARTHWKLADGDERGAHLKTAQQLSEQSMQLWQSIQDEGKLVARDASEPDDSTRLLANCVADLNQSVSR